MSLCLYIPSLPLSRYIECFWYISLKVPYRREKILPSGRLELIFNFDDPFRLYDRDHPERFSLHAESWLVGLQTGYLLNEPVGRTHMIGVRFRPGGTYPFFRLPAAEIADQVIPVEALWNGFVAEAREKLYVQPDNAARFAALEQMLLSQLQETSHRFPAVQHAVAEITRRRGSLSILDLSAALGMTPKSLAVLFKEMVGVSPKVLARLYRFQSILAQLHQPQAVKWALVAHGSDYYDQSHFIHDFKAFSGLTPGEYLALRDRYGVTPGDPEDTYFVPIS